MIPCPALLPDDGKISYYAHGSHGTACKEGGDMYNRMPLLAPCLHRYKTFHHLKIHVSVCVGAFTDEITTVLSP